MHGTTCYLYLLCYFTYRTKVYSCETKDELLKTEGSFDMIILGDLCIFLVLSMRCKE